VTARANSLPPGRTQEAWKQRQLNPSRDTIINAKTRLKHVRHVGHERASTFWNERPQKTMNPVKVGPAVLCAPIGVTWTMTAPTE
jgi:hypothetical protein